MNQSFSVEETCEICNPDADATSSCGRCSQCEVHGDLVADIVWKLVGQAVDEAAVGERVLFMLWDLSASALEGIARKVPASIDGRTLLLKLHPQAAPKLQVDPKHLSGESPIHWRHSDAAEVIVCAPSDAQRQGIGAGLGPVSRIDEGRVIAQTNAWLEVFDDSGEAKTYLRAALEGLRDANICLDLRMWVDFIEAIRAQGFAYSADVRIKNAMPALRIPKDGITKLPAFKEAGNPKATAKAFSSAFVDARLEAGAYATLMTPKHERVDIGAVREEIANFPDNGEPDIVSALKTAAALLDDAQNVRPGTWRASQAAFCEQVSWDRIGAHIFGGTRRTNQPGLGEQTLRYIEGDYRDELTDDERRLLVDLKKTAPKEPRDVEIEFYNRWQERLYAHAPALFKAWQKRLFSKEVLAHDLPSVFADAFESLIIAGSEALSDMKDPCVLVRATRHNKESYWKSLDPEVLQLFQFELRALRGLFGDWVVWDIDAAFQTSGSTYARSAEARKIDLELYLVEADEIRDLAGLKAPPKSATRVKATWQPGKSAKDEPISLALVEDIAALAKGVADKESVLRPLTFAPRATGDDVRASSTTLTDRNSFSDVVQSQSGRTFDRVTLRHSDLLAEIHARLKNLKSTQSVDPAPLDAALAAVEEFEARFAEAICAIADDPETAFPGPLIDTQARAFGTLCRAVRLPATAGNTGQEIRALVAQIGLVVSDGVEPMAILTAWHPLRLAERRAKIAELADFVETVLTSGAALKADLTVAFQERRVSGGRWVFPEVAQVGDRTMISVEDVGGYSLMVPADCVSRSQEALEASAPSAARKFMEGVDQYLDVHPHEATNLSAAIFDSESQSLPREVARELAKRLHRRPELRCDLVITHRDQARMRKIYQSQNMRLAAENISETARGFLSRLRVDVRSNSLSRRQDDDTRDLDLVVLHDAISHHARPTWVEEPQSSDKLDPDFDSSMARRPRRRMTETDSSGVGIYLSLPRPPRAVAEYHDVLYELSKGGFLPAGFHGVLIRHVSFGNPEVRDLVERAHQLAEWVITYDKVSSRRLMERCGVQIISDISVPGAEGRVIISAGKIDSRLKKNVADDLVNSCGFDADGAMQFADRVLRDVLTISGQKLLSAARYQNASLEMIGLAVMRAQMEAALQGTVAAQPIWISLDDYRGWFLSEKGKVADAVGVVIDDNGDAFRVFFHIGEAKFVNKEAETATIKEAGRQVRDTVDRLKRLFIDNDDEISRAAWCSRLGDLLVNRDGVTERLPEPARRAAFFDALAAGDVSFHISGEAVICLHDDHGVVSRIEPDPDREHLRHHVLTTPAIRQTLLKVADGGLPDREGLRDISWFPSADRAPDTGKARPTPPVEETGHARDLAGPETGASPSDPTDPMPSGDAAAAGSQVAPEVRETPPGDPAPSAGPSFLPAPVCAVLKDMASREHGAIDDPESVAWAERVATDTQRALSQFKMQAEFADPKYRLTPNGALITFRGHHSLTVDKLEKRVGELLTTYGIEVADIRPGRGKIQVFVSREKRANVPLASSWLGAPWPDRAPGSFVSLILGMREDDGQLLYLNLAEPFAGYEAHGPHTLIAGETGSGKGILTQNLLLQLITFNDPREAELILVDPKKGVDFTWLGGAPQMVRDIVTDIPEATAILNDLTVQMDQRYERLSAAGAANIAEFNGKVAPSERMSRIVLVHDELGAWMAENKDYQDVVLSAVANLGMKARAAGIHLVLITQRADADAVPPRLRDNMGNRLCLKVQNSTGSRMVMNTVGAEKLLGKGHLACILANEPEPPGQNFFVVQVPYAGTEDVRRLADAAKSFWVGMQT